jgi:predicted ATPase
MILRRLLESLMQAGVVCVMTSKYVGDCSASSFD